MSHVVRRYYVLVMDQTAGLQLHVICVLVYWVELPNFWAEIAVNVSVKMVVYYTNQ